MDIDNHKCVFLELDRSAAFDTCDISVFLRRLWIVHGISGTALDKIISYLTNRSQRVTIDGDFSNPIDLECGFPQGSKICPQFYKRYTKPLSLVIMDIVRRHFYADDSQLHTSAGVSSVPEQTEAVGYLESAIRDVSKWMFSNKLKLNTDKTEFLILRSKYRANNISIKSLRVGNDIIDESKSAKNLGVHIDNELSFERHVISICKACYMQIAAIWKIRKCIDENTAKILVNALVVSKLDYCKMPHVAIDS